MNKRVVKCGICGEAHITTGKTHFVHCGTKQEINEVKIVKTTKVIDGQEVHSVRKEHINHQIYGPTMEVQNGKKVCSLTKEELQYSPIINMDVCNCKDCKFGKVLRCTGRCWKRDERVHATPYGLEGNDMSIVVGRRNPNAPPASMLNFLIGERMRFNDMKFVPDQDKSQLSQIYYSKRFETVVFEYTDITGQKKVLLLDKLKGYEDYYNLPKGHKQRGTVFIYYRRGDVMTYYDNHYHIKVDSKGNRLIVDQFCFWSKEDGFFFYPFKDRVVKNFEFKQNKKYLYIPSKNMGIIEGELFTELSEDFCYRVIETVRNNTNNRDNRFYAYIVEKGNLPIVKALAKRLTRPSQMKKYPGMNTYQRQTLYEKTKPHTLQPKGIDTNVSTKESMIHLDLGDGRTIGNSIMDVQRLYTLYCKKYEKPGAFCVSEDELFSKDEAVLRAVGFFKSEEDELLFKTIKEEVINLINEEYESPVDFVFDESEGLKEIIPKQYKSNTWYDIDEIYEDWQEVKEVSWTSSYGTHKYVTIYEYYPLTTREEVVVKEVTECIGDLTYADEVIDKIKELLATDEELPRAKMNEVLGFLKNFDEDIEVDSWIHDEYIQWHEMQDQEEDSLGFLEDYFEHTQDLLDDAPKKKVFTNIVKLSEKGEKRFQRLQKKFNRPLEFKNKGFFGNNPVPQDIFSEGEAVYKELQKQFKENPEDDNLPLEDIIRYLINQDGNISIMNYDPSIMDADYKIKASYDTMSVIGASQMVRSLLVEEHKERINGKLRTIIDNAPLVRAIAGYFISLKNVPQVVISGLGTCVDSALVLAIILLNKYCGYNIKLVLACPGNVTEFFKDTEVNRAIIGYCYKYNIPIISFVEEGHVHDLTNVEYYDPYYRLRNDYMGENSNRVVNFMSRKVGGTAYTCEVKQHFHKEACRLRTKAKAYEAKAERALDRDEWKKSNYLKDLAKAERDEADRIDGKVIYVIKPEDVLEGPLTNRPIKVVKSSTKIDSRVNDRELCSRRAQIIRDFTAPYSQRILSMVKRWNKDLMISLMVILGRDFDALSSGIKKLFLEIIGEEEYASIREMCFNDQTLEYYELLGKHMDAYFDPRYFPGHYSCPWKAPSHRKNVRYNGVYDSDHQLVPPHFIEVRINSSNKKRDEIKRNKILMANAVIPVNNYVYWCNMIDSFVTRNIRFPSPKKEKVNKTRSKKVRTPIEKIKYEIFIWRELLKLEARGTQSNLARQAMGSHTDSDSQQSQPEKWFKEGSIEKIIAGLKEQLSILESNA